MKTATDAAIRGFADAITTCDIDAALEVCHPEIEFLSMLAVDGMPYRGHRGIRRYFEDIQSAWEEWRADVHWTAPVPDGRIIIEMTMVARGKGSGAPVSNFAAHIWTLKDGLLLRNEPYRDRAEAERAAGL